MAKTDWTIKDSVLPKDMNQIGQEINDLGMSATVWLGTTEGSSAAYTVTSSKVSSLFEGLRVSFRAHIASGSNPTLQINSLGAVPIKKPNGRVAKLDANGVYTLVFDGTAFILQGEGGEYGTATAADVLAPKTIGTENGIVTGTIPRIDRAIKFGSWKNPSGGKVVNAYTNQGDGFPAGYIDPNSELTIEIFDNNLVPGNIRGGTTVLGVQGDTRVVDTWTTSAEAATAADILTTKKAFVNGAAIAGTMPNRSAENNHMPGLAKDVFPGDRYFIQPPHGYYNGQTWVAAAEPNLTANNIRAGVSVGGLVGTLVEGKPFASGSAIVKGPMEIGTELGGRQNTAYIEVNGLAFVPKRIVVHNGAYVSAIHVAEIGITGIIQNHWNLLYGNYFAQVFSGTYFTIPVSSKNTAIIGSTVYWEVYG
ncbi:hypothetical protein AB4124_05955 [Paenibacillus sp. 2KB_20]|uniref:hypothetical protein n=1 Tax=Paenibacillus sp. 2KB_20 TaxID=3232977 RepID=UPI003F99889D